MMLRYIIVNLILLVGLLHAEIVLPIQKGWSLIGTPKDLEDLSTFTEQNVELIWAYDAESQKWLAYSPNSETSQTLLSKNITTLESLKSYQGFWILSSKDWLLSFTKSDKESTNSKNIELYSGWNLVSLPVDMRVSPSLFGSDSVWKYSESNEWEAFGIDVNESDVQKLSTISNSNGIWVYSETNKTIELSQTSSTLDTFDSNESMIHYIRTMLLNNQRPYYGCFDFELLDFNTTIVSEPTVIEDVEVTEDSSAVTDTTTTNIQEEGVDESDIVKHDGTNIFYLSNSEKKILITSFSNLANGDFSPINAIDLFQNSYPSSIYLHNEILVVIYKYYKNYDMLSSRSIVEFYDVSDIHNVTKVKSIAFDGRYINSRLIGEKLYFISSFRPQIKVEYPKIYLDIECNPMDGLSYDSSECYSAYYEYIGEEKEVEGSDTVSVDVGFLSSATIQRASQYKRYKYDYTKPSIKSEYLVPYLYIDGDTNSSMLNPQSLYAPLKLDQISNITTIMELNVSTQTITDSISYLGESTEEYMSQNSLYLVSESYPYYYDFRTFKHQSTIYKFDINPLHYVGNGVVDGYTLNQFSLSEYNDTLRVATTSGFSWNGMGTNNSIFTLQDVNGSFEKVGNLEGLGKENETIKAVRFLADKGYVVTFEQTDPFYTLDLSDPTNPIKVGELNVTGFSEYIHPVNDTQLLSIGRDADENGIRGGLQLELFDISDFANPVILDKKIIGDRSYISEAEYDHRAFTFRESDALFGFPYRTYRDYNKNNFAYYTLEDNNISQLGEMSVNTDSYYSSWKSRGVFFNSNGERYVIFFSNGKFKSQKVD